MSVQKWNSKVQFPTDSNFVNRLTGVVFDTSKNSGNPMFTLTFEVVSPAEVEVGTEKFNIAGVTCDVYLVTKNVDPEKAENTERYRNETTRLLGLNPDEIDWNNPKSYFEALKGKLFLTMMSPDIVEQTKNPTAAQIEEGKKKGLKPNQIKGDIMKNPITGKAMVNYFPKIREIFGPAPAQDGTQVPY